MATLEAFDAGQPIDLKLILAVENALRHLSDTRVRLVPAPRVWKDSNPQGSVKGPKWQEKARIKGLLAARDGAACAYCGHDFYNLTEATLDHVIPNCIVGHWEPWNLLLACEPCNNQKADLLPLVLMPMLCTTLTAADRWLQAKAEKKRASRRAKKRRANDRRRARRRHDAAMAAARKQISALSGTPYRLALEAAPARAALPSGTGQ
jgi:hypothetical protein